MTTTDYWEATLDCGCRVSLDYGEYGGVVVDGGRIVTACSMHSIGQNIAGLRASDETW